VKGEFIGGSDIMMEMFEEGELGALMAEKGISTAN
jgi:monothiol glutaredoxin